MCPKNTPPNFSAKELKMCPKNTPPNFSAKEQIICEITVAL